MKKVLAIMGSPRKGKNTDLLLDEVLKGFDKKQIEILKIYLRDLNILPCTACNYCAKHEKCCINDDMYLLYNAFDNSDGIIIASPLYFNSVSSLTKIIIDRCQVFWENRSILKNNSIFNNKKIGMFLSTAGSPYKQGKFDAAKSTISLFFKSINTQYKYNCFACNTDNVAVNYQSNTLKQAYSLGKNFFNLD